MNKNYRIGNVQTQELIKRFKKLAAKHAEAEIKAKYLDQVIAYVENNVDLAQREGFPESATLQDIYMAQNNAGKHLARENREVKEQYNSLLTKHKALIEDHKDLERDCDDMIVEIDDLEQERDELKAKLTRYEEQSIKTDVSVGRL